MRRLAGGQELPPRWKAAKELSVAIKSTSQREVTAECLQLRRSGPQTCMCFVLVSHNIPVGSLPLPSHSVTKVFLIAYLRFATAHASCHMGQFSAMMEEIVYKLCFLPDRVTLHSGHFGKSERRSCGTRYHLPSSFCCNSMTILPFICISSRYSKFLTSYSQQMDYPDN